MVGAQNFAPLQISSKKATVYKPDSVEFCHLSWRNVAVALQQPTLRVGRAALKPRFTWSFNP